MKSIFFVGTALIVFSLDVFAVNPLDKLPPYVAKKHISLAGDECQSDLPSDSESFSLGKDKNLYLVPCLMGAYQGYSKGYITRDTDKSVTPLMVLAYDEISKSVVSSLDLGTVSFDPQTKTLYTYAKGRGLGDCGQSSESKILVDEYGIVSVKTTEIRAKINCDGNYDAWPVVFKQD